MLKVKKSKYSSLPKSFITAAKVGIDNEITRLGLVKGPTKNASKPQKLGERPIKPRTNIDYEKHFKGLRLLLFN